MRNQYFVVWNNITICQLSNDPDDLQHQFTTNKKRALARANKLKKLFPEANYTMHVLPAAVNEKRKK